MVTIDAVNEVALRAGEVVLRHYRANDAWVKKKADGSPVTGVDLEAEEIIRDGLLRLDGSIPYVSEERELPAYDVRRAWPRYWLVDPLDGTKEFINRTDEFTVNIALIDGGEPLLGVVVAPASGLLYYARTGDGAWKREGARSPELLRSTLADPSGPLRIVESRSHPSPALEAFLEPFTIAERVKSGSSLKFCVVADGRADVYPRLGPTMEWDVAAGDCVYRNSGYPKPHPGTLRYNKPSLKNGSFVIGLAPGTYELPDDERSQKSEDSSQNEV
ncbi:MAG: 3'(2'),5'-bisphosphate nucleotidase CysQ [Vicinamibacterales bacterium]|nr:3'(2'),5'-bisphosphate nucleotidase CysQ [Vicinamibacterales bacterium]